MGAESIIANIAAGGIGEALDGISKVIDSAKSKSPETAMQLEAIKAGLVKQQLDLQKTAIGADVTLATSENDVTKTEAASQNKFAANWRPLIGYICGAAMGYSFVLQPFIVTGILIVQCIHSHTMFTKDMLPIIDMSQMWPALLGLLGLGGLRTYEKVKGVSDVGTQ